MREATRRTLGKAQFHTQLIAAHIMLSDRLAEMATGEGKTLAAVLTAATAALAGIPVHVITANDYLVDARCRAARPGLRALGLTVGAVTRPLDQAQRRAAYGCDITYCTAKELTFDYLRDRLIRRSVQSELHERVRRLESGAGRVDRLLLRGLWMALVDEADSILIDEARTPLILSQPRVNPQQQRYVEQALRWPGIWSQGAISGSTLRHRKPRSPRPGGPDWPNRPRRWAGCGRTAGIATRSWRWRWWRITCTSATSTTWCASARSS